jgi:hypothetical protein
MNNICIHHNIPLELDGKCLVCNKALRNEMIVVAIGTVAILVALCLTILNSC